MALIHHVDRLTPPWAKGAATSHWLRLFRFVALLIDIILEGVYTGRKAGLPNATQLPGQLLYGGYEDSIALRKYLAPDTGVLQGLTENPPALAKRVRHAQDVGDPSAWPRAGTISGVLGQIAGVLAGPSGAPLMRIVNRHGDWWTRNQDGTYTYQNISGTGLEYDASMNLLGPNTTTAHEWHWDFANVAPQPMVLHPDSPGEWWLIIYAPVNTPYGTANDLTFQDPGLFGDLWNDPATIVPVPNYPNEGTIGSNIPWQLVQLIVAVIRQRQTTGFDCSHVIVAFDPASFAPDGSSTAGSSRTAYPDGLWGEEYCLAGGVWIPSRLDSAEYIAVGPWGTRSPAP